VAGVTARYIFPSSEGLYMYITMARSRSGSLDPEKYRIVELLYRYASVSSNETYFDFDATFNPNSDNS
jgi:hypothetical protein